MHDSRFRNSFIRDAFASLVAMVFCVGAMFAHGGLQPDDITIKTDEELTALTARWNELSSSERRLLLHEVRARMQASKISAQRQLKRQIRRMPVQGTGTIVQRRYGRKSDGSVVVQTRVIQKRTPPRGAPASGRITFGFGFERRAQGQGHQTSPHESAANQAGIVVNQAQDVGAKRQSPALEP